MIEFGKITGDTDKNLIRVRMRTGESFYAAVATMGTNVSAPSAKWITANKDNFLALVTFEKDLDEAPMIIGFYPVRGADSVSYNTHERLILIVESLIKELRGARVNTQLGPQQFLPDTLFTLDELSEDLKSIKEDINNIRL